MNNEFPDTNEELVRIAEEISLLRKDFQAGISILNRIEKRLKASFQNYPEKSKAVSSSQNKETRNSKSKKREMSTKTREELLEIYSDLLDAIKQNGDKGFESKISEIQEQDILALAYEVAATPGQSSSLRKAQDGIRRRLQESLQLSFESKRVSP